MPTPWTAETLWPAQGEQIVAASLLARKARLEFELVARVILHQALHYILVSPESSGYQAQDKPLPPGWIVDADGHPSTDANRFYGPPRGGILPLGGSAGHKGFALGLLVDILGCVLNGVSSSDPDTLGNGVCFLVIDPVAFCPVDSFRQEVARTIEYVKSSAPAPGFEEVLVPGDLEFRTMRRREAEGIPIDERTWQAIQEHADRLGVSLEGISREE